MTTENNEGFDPRLDSLRNIPFQDFFRLYSDLDAQLQGFNDPNRAFMRSTETNTTDFIKGLRVQGGIHLAVAGGLDQALLQNALAKPDLSILCDVNVFALPIVYERLALLEKADGALDYYQKLNDRLKDNPSLDYGVGSVPYVTDNSFWSYGEHYKAVQRSWRRGSLKYIHADITTRGLSVGFKIARETGVPIRLIYVSNIFDYPSNWKGFRNFTDAVQQGIDERLVDPDAQFIAATIINDGLADAEAKPLERLVTAHHPLDI